MRRQRPEKPGVASNAVAVPASYHANRTKLMIDDGFAQKLRRYQCQRLWHFLCGHSENVPLTACEDDW